MVWRGGGGGVIMEERGGEEGERGRRSEEDNGTKILTAMLVEMPVLFLLGPTFVVRASTWSSLSMSSTQTHGQYAEMWKGV